MESQKFTNRLTNESSPYLLQHAHNPVDWYPWGPEALEKAENEDKLILVSIGYAACHWCHVMEHESFENEAIANLMNKHFVCIKVDREERPDIDQIYMEAVQLLNGNGGWPLNCFALPDGRPVYGGTYFRPEQWVQVLTGLTESYRSNNDRFIQVAQEIAEGMNRSELLELKPLDKAFRNEDLNEMLEQWKYQFDNEEGGTKRAPKFPMPNSYLFLLEYYYHTKDQVILDHIFLTLNKIAMGGIYDQIGGGFARYSVDAYWKVPHFEKMLYDNGQLVSLYSKAFQLTKHPQYKQVVFQTLEFINREMTSLEGAFYSSLDADSEGVEGKYYVWEKDEIDKWLTEDSSLFCEFYNISATGNLEDKKNILYTTDNQKKLAEKYNIDESELLDRINKMGKSLLNARGKRIRPRLDDKILTSWNALMLKGYTDAYRTFNETSFLEKALMSAEFISNHLIDKDFRILRNYKSGKSSINGFLDDYAFVIDAFINLYQATFDEKWLLLAKNISEYAITHFLDQKTGMFYYTSDQDKKLIARKFEIHDNVIPSSNSVMANNLFDLSRYFDEQKFLEISMQMLENMEENIKRNVQFHSNWTILLAKQIYPIYEIAIVGPDVSKMFAQFNNQFIPSAIYAACTENSQLPLLSNRKCIDDTSIYVCQDKVCQLPVYSIEEAMKIINKDKTV